MLIRGPITVAACGAVIIGALCVGRTAYAGDDPEAPAKAAPCKVALVSPVSGHAECVDPLGAAVDPPPPRPAPDADICLRHPELDPKDCKSAAKPAAPDGSSR